MEVVWSSTNAEDKDKVVPVKKRASAPKSRNGCGTCKIRRVKCGEEKPICLRCTTFGVICDGYTPVKKSKLDLAQTRRLVLQVAPRVLPKAHPANALTNAQPAPSSIHRSPAQNLFNNSDEWAYFQRFCGYATGELSAKREKGLWNQIVLQAAQREPAIRYAVTAIGALDLKLHSTANDEALVKSRKQFAYREYQKAIVGLRRTLVAKNCDIRTKLVACIVFACFECHEGNFGLARRQIFAGIKMMDEHEKKVEDLGGLHVEREFVDYFAMLEIQTSSFGGDRSNEQHMARLAANTKALESMPSEFKDPLDASYYISMNMLRAVHLQDIGAKENLCSDQPRFAPISWGPTVSELNDVLNTFKRWYQAFEPLYRRSRTPEGKHFSDSATLLRLQYLCNYLFVAAGSPNTSLYYRRYEKELWEVIASVKDVIKLIIAGSTFACDQMVVLPLAVTGLNYRHRAVRREAISIFKTLVRREGVWDASMLGKIIEWMAEIEEAELGDEIYVPEDGVAMIVDMKIDEPRRIVMVKCAKGIIGQPGKTEVFGTTLHW